MTANLKWQPLKLFDHRFVANVSALQRRDPELAAQLRELKPTVEFFIAADGDNVFLGRPAAGGVEVLPNPVPPAAARQIWGNLFPQGCLNVAVAIGGLGYGWLWDRVCKLPCKVDAAPGHRPPVYLLAADIERLWAVMHVLDWREMLADERFPIYVGPDAVAQLRDELIGRPGLPTPAACVRIDQQLWQEDLDVLLKTVIEARGRRLAELISRVKELYPPLSPRAWGERLNVKPLRVLGITSRYTTFLQYSMRDWLAAFEQLGHETKLVIEAADHEVHTNLAFAEACATFRPDLVVMIDHYRKEFGGLPEHVPCVMWVQDRLPNIFNLAAGRAQGPLDYVLGYSRRECTRELHYPESRFMSASVGVNDQRFAPRELTEAERRRFECDVSFVSHCTMPADAIIRQEIDRTADAGAKRLLADCFERLRAVYDAGHSLTEPLHIRRLLNQSMQEIGVQLENPGQLLDLFVQRINNALFRHQSIAWAAELDVNLHLYGRGWEAHPKFGRFARGVADNQATLPLIYAASKINLQVTPFGAAHQRLFDGLAAGGFFLLRHINGEDYDRISTKLWRWCLENDVHSGAEIMRRATPQIREWLDQVEVLCGEHPAIDAERFFAGVADTAEGGFIRSAATLFDEFDRVAFRNRGELHQRINHFLPHADERRQVADAMRRRVLERLTYKSITRRLLRFITNDLGHEAPLARAA